MSCKVDNNAFEIVITPSRKRKRLSQSRQSENTTPGSPKISNGFTNTAFSSTPKKEVKSLINKFNKFPPNKRNIGNENANNRFPNDPCLEIKSIFDLVNQSKNTEHENPFEVIRKPPKKKKKSDIEEVCFENPGLNLELPEKQFNPFEVKRSSPLKSVITDEPQCFVNPALNLRSQESTAVRNPFEIARIATVSEAAASASATATATNGVENPGLDLASGPLTIGIPFKPTLGYRIDFNDLTPSKMLAEKLIFSPLNSKIPRVLTDLSEGETTMDIGRELDRYQLELENSINEAKQRKTYIEERVFPEKLEDIKENSQEEEQESHETLEPKTPNLSEQEAQKCASLEDVETPTVQKVIDELVIQPEVKDCLMNKTYVKENVCSESFTDDEGIDYDSDDDDDVEINFKSPTPFVRNYRKADSLNCCVVKQHKKESLPGDKISPKTDIENNFKVKNIRNSIRKLIYPNKCNVTEKPPEKQSTVSHVFEAIRHSLRRRPQKQTSKEQSTNRPEISIIDATERKMKLKSNLIQIDYIEIEELTSQRKSSLRNSIRKSTRGVKNQILKSVFNKNNEEYVFAK